MEVQMIKRDCRPSPLPIICTIATVLANPGTQYGGAHHALIHIRGLTVVTVVVALTVQCFIAAGGGRLVSAQDAGDTSVINGVYCSGTAARPSGGSLLSSRFTPLKRALTARASVSLYGQTEDIDAESGYGASMMYQCRGDVTLPECSLCVPEALAMIDKKCSNPNFGQVELQGCGVIYSNQSIGGGNFYYLNKAYLLANGSTEFLRNRDMALANVTSQVIENKRKLGLYWAVDVVGSGAGHAGDVDAAASVCYALAQCHGYLPPSDCTYCLGLAKEDLGKLAGISPGGGRFSRGSCYFRYENYMIYYNTTGPDILKSLGPSPESTPSPSPALPRRIPPPGKGAVPLVAVLVSGASLFILGSLLGWFSHGRIRTHKTHASHPPEFGKLDASLDSDGDHVGPHIDFRHADSIQHFSLVQLHKATNNFHLGNKIGDEGFGAVYLGILDNGVKVSIKKLMQMSNYGKEQFLNEVKLIRSLRHRNLVRIIGCSVEGEERFLVYEYVSNQSLDKLLFASDGRDILTWNKRMAILEGVARGLTYLHHDSHMCIIHRDIKAGNVLLDGSLNPKVADFGLAKLFASDRPHMSTNTVGTPGYIAPEYALNGHVSTKSDVFSFGLLMLEVISGRRIFEQSALIDQRYLLHWTWRLHKEGRELEILDEAMANDWVEEEAKRFIRVALLCCQNSPTERPSMLVVLEMLVNLSLLDIPTMPTYITSTDRFSHQYA